MTDPDRPPIPIARPLIGEEEKAAVLRALESGQLAQGPRVAGFEEAFARYVGSAHAIAVSSGTAALVVALQAAGVGPGDEVITTAFSFIATATSIVACGARPVFVDVAEFDGNLDPERVEAAITDCTRAVLPVHLYGHPARAAELAEICDRRGLVLVEDAAQAHGAEHCGRRVGSFGTGCFSFYPTKNMTTGEGGIITTDDPELAARARAIRNHGQVERYVHASFGLNWRMTDLAAAIGLAQLAHLEAWNGVRIANARRLSAMILDAGLEPEVLSPPRVRPGDRHVFHQYTVRVSNRNAVAEKLKAAGIGTAVHYPVPIHRQPVMQTLGLSTPPLAVAESLAARVLSLPIHPALTAEDVERVGQGLISAVGS